MRMNCACGPTSDIEVTAVTPLGGYRLRFVFSDGSAGEKDFGDLVAFDAPMTRELADTALFAQVFVKNGAPVWPNGLDLAPWTLHEEMKRSGALTPPQQTH